MSKTIETTNNVTVNNAIIENNEKTNTTVTDLLSVNELKKFFVECGIIPKYTDNAHYVGCGTRANVFSVNALKKQYNIYCGDEVFNALNEKPIKTVEYIINGNSTDKTRNNMIVAKTTTDLKKLLAIIKKSFAQYAIA